MAKKRDLIQETPPKRRKLSSEGLVPPSETHILQRSPSPDSGLASWSRSIRGVFSNMAGGDQTNEVINGATPEPSNFLTTASRIYSTVSSQIPRLPENLGLAASIARTKLLNGGMTDDKKYEVSADKLLPIELPPSAYIFFFVHTMHHNMKLTERQLEAIIQAAVSFPPKSRACQELSGLLIKPLWNDLHHPPLAYLGDEFKYRKSDGSNNNIMYPRMGAAGSPYARSVTPKTLAPSVLPDPGLIFDTIFARGERPNEHPSRISSVLFYLASIITHGRLGFPGCGCKIG